MSRTGVAPPPGDTPNTSAAPPAGNNATTPAAGGEPDRWYKARPIEGLSWRIAIRQADMLIRRAQARAEVAHVDSRGRRKLSECRDAALLEKVADEVWNALRTPPENVGEAYAFDEEVERTWPRSNPCA